MTPINRQTLTDIGFIEDLHEEALFLDIDRNIEIYNSPDKRLIVRKGPNNISYENGWNLHIDNSDFQTIASCDVDCIEQILTISDIYKNY